MPKKPNQWSLDRAYYLIPENETKIRKTLEIIKSIELGNKTQDDGLSEAVSLGLFPSPQRYLTSTQTLLNSIGVICEPFKLTEIGDYFINKKISYRDLIFLQLLKKEFKYDEHADVLRPVFLVLNVLLKLLNSKVEDCWIDAYDYLTHLTEIKYKKDIDSCVTNILKDRNGNRELKFEYQDFEVWMYALDTAGLLKPYDSADVSISKAKYTLNFEELDLINMLVANEDKLEILNEYSHRQGNRGDVLKVFGKVDNGFYNILPSIKLSKGFSINNLSFNEKNFINEYLFGKLSLHKIDYSLAVPQEVHDTQGFLTSLFVKSLGFANSDYKGIFYPFRNRKYLLKYHSEYKNLGKVYELLFGEMEDLIDMQNLTKIDYSLKQKGGINKIYYGAPGCGKSYKVKKDLSDVGVEKVNIIRTVFHPEYANSDFVGQIMPKVDDKGNVSYDFNPGPFALAIKQALITNDMVYFVIEEINRGNAAAIFGDLFQLLDRSKDDEDLGRSEYDIESPNLEKYLIKSIREQGIDIGDDYHLFIPSNLTILATMNSSDQNVFTLDTAFKRRWYFEQVDNDIVNDQNHSYKNWYVPGTNVTWQDFMLKINNKILKYKVDNQTNEDKRLGKYFVSKDCLVQNSGDFNEDAAKNFAYKVLEYLWNDVCKIGKEEWFNLDEYKTLEDLIDGFMSANSGNPLEIFNDNELFVLDENQ